jgi:hypothetical protein
MFDKDIFQLTSEPWPNQVFSKDFDVYFFLKFPHNEYGEGGYLRPFGLMNNLEDKWLYIESTNGNMQLKMNVNEFKGLDDYTNRYESIGLHEERFLFWYSEHEKWAMVSDQKYGICIYGMDYRLAYHLGYFFIDSFISPNAFLEKAGLENHLDIFIKNYKPSQLLYEGNKENDMWVVTYLQCHVPTEDDKFFYWKNFEPFTNTILKLLNGCKSIYMWPNQVWERRYWQNKQWYSTGKNAATGGWQKFTYTNCEKVSTKFLDDNEHLRLAFEGDLEGSEQLYRAKKEGLIKFYGFNIYANKYTNCKAYYFGEDFNVSSGLYDNGEKADQYNQNIRITYRKSSFDPKHIDEAIESLKDICYVKKITTEEHPMTFVEFSKDEPVKMHSMVSYIPKGVRALIYDKIEYKQGG